MSITRREELESTSLKDLYATHVNKGKEETLKIISVEVMEGCIENILNGCELPYNIVVLPRGLKVIDGLETYLSEFGIVADLYFAKAIGLIQVNVNQFTK